MKRRGCKEMLFLYSPKGIGKNGQNGQISTSAKQALLKGNPIARREAALYRELYSILRGWILSRSKKENFTEKLLYEFFLP